MRRVVCTVVAGGVVLQSDDDVRTVGHGRRGIARRGRHPSSLAPSRAGPHYRLRELVPHLHDDVCAAMCVGVRVGMQAGTCRVGGWTRTSTAEILWL